MRPTYRSVTPTADEPGSGTRLADCPVLAGQECRSKDGYGHPSLPHRTVTDPRSPSLVDADPLRLILTAMDAPTRLGPRP